MRYRKNAEEGETRINADYTYYSYKFIGVKPTSYAPFEVNGAGPSQLLRTLTLICDMCLVDLTGDVSGSSAKSTNLGNRTSLVFADLPSADSDDVEEDSGDEDDEEDYEDELEEYEDEYDEYDEWDDENEENID